MITHQWAKTIAVAGLVLAIGAIVTGTRRTRPLLIVLDGRSDGRVFEGIGALSAGASSRLLIDYPEPERSQILDYLFKPGYGAALQHLKIEVGADVNSTDGSEPSHARTRDDRDYSRGYEWWLIAEALKRNPRIILEALPWGAPAWIGNGTFYSADMVTYMVDFLTGARREHHLNFAYVGIWNERPYDAQYVKDLRRALDGAHLEGVKIVCCDSYDADQPQPWQVARQLQTDAALNAAVTVIGTHYPQSHGQLNTTDEARKSGKPLWASEDQPNDGAGPILSRDWSSGGRVMANRYNKNYLEGALTKTEVWSPVTAYYDSLAAPNSGLMYANTPWSGFYRVQSTIWVTAHTTQFAQPGWHYLDNSSGTLAAGGTYVALRSERGEDWSVVLETVGSHKPQTLAFQVNANLAQSTIHLWETNSSRQFEHIIDIHPRNGRFQFAFEPDAIYSLTTTTGQGKGTATPRTNRPFPFPYRDDFEQPHFGLVPRYLADQDGAFEIHACHRRPGQCLEQVIRRKPISWAQTPDPFTLAGDSAWTDYTVSADVLLTHDGTATLLGRIDASDYVDEKAAWPSGYILRIEHDGHWALMSAHYHQPTTTLASGNANPTTDQWHNVKLAFRGDQVNVTLDHRLLVQVQSGEHTHGLFAVGTGWNTAQFDNLAVD